MEDSEKRRKEMYQGLWFGTIVLPILIIAVWTIPIIKNEFDLKSQIILTLISFVGLIGGWIHFFHQKKRDEEPELKEATKEKIIKSVNIFHGIGFNFESIKWTIASLLFFAGGIYILITDKSYWWIGLMFIILSILLITVIKTFWRISKEKIKGRYY